MSRLDFFNTIPYLILGFALSTLMGCYDHAICMHDKRVDLPFSGEFKGLTVSTHDPEDGPGEEPVAVDFKRIGHRKKKGLYSIKKDNHHYQARICLDPNHANTYILEPELGASAVQVGGRNITPTPAHWIKITDDSIDGEKLTFGKMALIEDKVMELGLEYTEWVYRGQARLVLFNSGIPQPSDVLQAFEHVPLIQLERK